MFPTCSNRPYIILKNNFPYRYIVEISKRCNALVINLVNIEERFMQIAVRKRENSLDPRVKYFANHLIL